MPVYFMSDLDFNCVNEKTRKPRLGTKTHGKVSPSLPKRQSRIEKNPKIETKTMPVMKVGFSTPEKLLIDMLSSSAIFKPIPQLAKARIR